MRPVAGAGSDLAPPRRAFPGRRRRAQQRHRGGLHRARPRPALRSRAPDRRLPCPGNGPRPHAEAQRRPRGDRIVGSVARRRSAGARRSAPRRLGSGNANDSWLRRRGRRSARAPRRHRRAECRSSAAGRGVRRKQPRGRRRARAATGDRAQSVSPSDPSPPRGAREFPAALHAPEWRCRGDKKQRCRGAHR